jgi:hypothetical protein
VIASDVQVLFDHVGVQAFEGSLDAHRNWELGARAEVTLAFVERARLALLPIVALRESVDTDARVAGVLDRMCAYVVRVRG